MTTTARLDRPAGTRPTAPGRRLHKHHAYPSLPSFPACLPKALRGPLATLTLEQLNDYMEIAELERKGWGHPRAVAAMGAVGSPDGEHDDRDDDPEVDDDDGAEEYETDDEDDSDITDSDLDSDTDDSNIDDATGVYIGDIIKGAPSSVAEAITDRDPHHTYCRMHASIGEDIDDRQDSHGGWVDFNLPTTAELMDTTPTKIDLGVLAVIQHDIGGEAGGA